MTATIRWLTLALALVAAATGHAAEEIREFDVKIVVEPDGALLVTETLRVQVEGIGIERGIYRDIPVEYREEDGRVSLTSLEVEEVLRNGASEPYTTSRQGADMRIRIGEADVYLPTPSEQVYLIRYRTIGHLRAAGDVDELYWNVTGDRWDFPILAASVEIRLPDGTPILQDAAYTGPRGATGTDFAKLEAGDGIYRARTTRRLAAGEGFTVAIGWPPGAVTIPPVRYGVPGIGGYRDPPMTFRGTPLAPFAALLGTLIGALALAAFWTQVGRDPPDGAIYPQFDPPNGLSPAAMRYVNRRMFDRRCLTAAIVSMAVKGAVRIVETERGGLFGGREFTLEPLGSPGRNLSIGENAAYSALFPSGASVTLKSDKTNGGRVDRARSQLRSKLWDEHYGASFRRNTLYTAGGVLIGSLASFVLIGIVEYWYIPVFLQWFGPAVLLGLLVYGGGFLLLELRDSRGGGGFALRRLVPSLPFAIFASIAAFQLGGVFTLSMITDALDPGVALSGAAFGVIAALFHFLMAAPTKSGRRLMDAIEGFRLYMSVAEEDRLNILNPPEKTPELFERLLPYAIALGIAHQWSQKFAGVLAGTTVASTWYSGAHEFDADNMDREFAHAVASTSAPASRGSGGSGGGGSSGGGGGGGGGGGW